MRNGKINAKPIGGRIALSTKQSRAYRTNERNKKPKRRPKGLLSDATDQPIVFDLRIAKDVEAIERFDLVDDLEQDAQDEFIYMLHMAKIGFVATTYLAIVEAIS